MQKQDLVNLSPVRLFDDAANGGLKAGEMGLVTAKKGLGKTSVLVQFGLDSILNDKQLVHVSFDQHSSNVISWYDSILNEIGKKKSISDIAEIASEIVKDRTILNFNQETFTLPKVVSTLKALKDAGIKVSALVVDGADLDKVGADDMKCVADFAKKEKICVWFSSTNESDVLADSCKSDILPMFSTVCHIASDGTALAMNILKCDGKDYSGKVKLDTKTLLMCKQ